MPLLIRIFCALFRRPRGRPGRCCVVRVSLASPVSAPELARAVMLAMECRRQERRFEAQRKAEIEAPLGD